jgi:cyclic pyranopterin phosphate synthase
LLTLEQIARVVQAAAGLGFSKVRLTGGEPLVRRGLVDLVGMVSATPGVREVAMTTNATLLAPLAAPLAAAGLQRVNISLDSLQPERFRTITRQGDLAAAMEGIRAAEAAGLSPLKVNVVVLRGVNDDELGEFARLTYTHPWHVRFIEVMPLAGDLARTPGLPPAAERLVTVAEMRDRLESAGRLLPDPGPNGNGPARYFRLPGAAGTLGFISPLSEHFCAGCNRLRLTAEGWLRTCLFSADGVFLKPALDAGASATEIQALIAQAVGLKPEARPAGLDSGIAGQAMSQIGG